MSSASKKDGSPQEKSADTSGNRSSTSREYPERASNTTGGFSSLLWRARPFLCGKKRDLDESARTEPARYFELLPVSQALLPKNRGSARSHQGCLKSGRQSSYNSPWTNAGHVALLLEIHFGYRAAGVGRFKPQYRLTQQDEARKGTVMSWYLEVLKK